MLSVSGRPVVSGALLGIGMGRWTTLALGVQL